MGNNRHQAGFTLIEILVVIVLIAVASALIVPNYFEVTAKSPADEARRLQQALRLAAEEAVLGSQQLRFVAWSDRYRFEQANAEGVWTPLSDPPFQPWTLDPEIRISEIYQPDLPVDQASDRSRDMATDNPPLATITFQPDGSMEPSRITLAAPSHPERHAIIDVRPGPGGIRLQPEAQP